MNRTLAAAGMAALIIFTTLSAQAGPGDTTVVRTFNFNQRGDVKDGRFLFPPATTRFEKILMYYTLKCDPQQNPACGEWDYLTYTNLYQHTGRFDSTRRTHANFTVNRQNRDTLQYITTESWKYTTRKQRIAVYDDPSSLRTAHIGSGATQTALPFPAGAPDARSIVMWRAAELTAAGLTAGNILGLRFNITAGGGAIAGLRIRMRQTPVSTIDSIAPEQPGYITVYQQGATTLATGWNPIRFTTPYIWDGTSNLLVDVSFTGGAGAGIQLSGDDAGSNLATSSSAADFALAFDGNDLVSLPAQVFASIDTAVTVSLWQYGDVTAQPRNCSIFEALTATGKRAINVHLPWGDSHVYFDAGNDAGYDRVERLTDNVGQFRGQWNQWTFVKSTGAGQMKVYLNGEIWHGGNGMVKPFGKIGRFSLGSNGNGDANFYAGMIDDFSVWNIELRQPVIRSWKNRSVDATHPNFANLVASWSFNEGQGAEAFDLNGANAGTLVGRPRWTSFQGDRVKGFTASPIRPEVVFEQGAFTTHIDTLVVVDSAAQAPMMVILYSDTLNPQIPTDTMYVWSPWYRYTFDANGNVVDSTYIAPTGTLVRVDNPYYDPPFEVVNRFELGRFITPYGINLDLGEGWTWVYDVTDFAPLLADSVHLSAGNWQELLDLKFVMIEGTPARDVVKIQNLWQGNYGLKDMATKVTPIMVDLDPAARMVKLRTTVTGHGMGATNNCAEFCPNTHRVTVDGTQRWSWEILQECALNPLYPQGGTWIYNRAGWCPGMPCTTKEFEITPWLQGPRVQLDYDTDYDPDGNYIIEAQLVSYADPNHQLDAAVEDIIEPNSFKLFTRSNPSCGRPRIVIRNKGARELTSLDITYGVVGGMTGSHHWTGSLKFLESTEVVLPALGPSSTTTGGEFMARVSAPNGGEDEYPRNDEMRVRFNPVVVYNTDIVIMLKTNFKGGESLYQIFDDKGMPVFTKGGFGNNLLYKDTIRLAPGCYEFVLTDAGDNGLSFFANNDGNGSCTVRLAGGGAVKTFNPDFGRETRLQFVRANVAGLESLPPDDIALRMFPNPAGGDVTLDFRISARASVRFELYTMQGRRVGGIETTDYIPGAHQARLDLGGLAPGSYMLMMMRDGVTVKTANINVVR